MAASTNLFETTEGIAARISFDLAIIAGNLGVEHCLLAQLRNRRLDVTCSNVSSSADQNLGVPSRFDLAKWPGLEAVATGLRPLWSESNAGNLQEASGGALKHIAAVRVHDFGLDRVLIFCNTDQDAEPRYDKTEVDGQCMWFGNELRLLLARDAFAASMRQGSRSEMQRRAAALLVAEQWINKSRNQSIVEARSDEIMATYLDMSSSLALRFARPGTSSHLIVEQDRDAEQKCKITFSLASPASSVPLSLGEISETLFSRLAVVRWRLAQLGNHASPAPTFCFTSDGNPCLGPDGKPKVDNLGEIERCLASLRDHLSDGLNYSPSSPVVHQPNKRNLRLEWLRTEWLLLRRLAEADLRSPAGQTAEKLAQACVKLKLIDRELLCEATRDFLWEHLKSTRAESGGGIFVTSEWLFCYFATMLLQEDTLSSRLLGEEKRKPALDPKDVVEYVYHLAGCALYLLHWVKWCGSEKAREQEGATPPVPRFSDLGLRSDRLVDQAQMYLVCDYAHEACGADRELAFADCFRNVLSQEPMLYASDEKHRDHLHHEIDVFLMGLLVLNARITRGLRSRTLQDLLCARADFPVADTLGLWATAALYHDVGFTLDIAARALKVSGDSSGLIHTPPIAEWLKAATDGFAAATSRLGEALRETNPGLGPDDNPQELAKDHGVISWFYLKHAVDRTRDPGKWRPAMEAVFLHNLERKSIVTAEKPLAFLLVLCDHLQEWGRPRVNRGDLASAMVASLHHKSDTEFDRKSAATGVRINLALDGAPSSVHFTEGRMDFTVVHEDTEPEDAIEPAVYWAQYCWELQRLDMQHGWPDVYLRISHTLNPRMTAGTGPVLEMSLLCDFSRERPEGLCLEDFTQECQDVPCKGPISYEFSVDKDSPRVEIVSFDLKRLYSKRTIQRKPEGLYPNFRKFKLRKLVDYGIITVPTDYI